MSIRPARMCGPPATGRWQYPLGGPVHKERTWSKPGPVLGYKDSNLENDGVRVRCLTVWLWAIVLSTKIII